MAVALVPLVAGPASAAPPSNDEAVAATVISLGDRVTQDTTGATTNAGDDALNANCGAPFTNASVWYSYSPIVTGNAVLDASASDYGTGLMVFDGTPTADSLITCGPGAVGLHAVSGHTYTIMVFSDNETIGGNLILKLKDAPTPTAHVTIDKHGVAFHGGAARIHGTYKCTHGESFAGVSVHLKQLAGRLKIQGDAGANARCNGKTHTWSARVVSPVGTYAPGAASAKVSAFACGILQCRQDRAKTKLHLSKASGPNRTWMTHPTKGLNAHPRPLIGRQKIWPNS